MPDHGQLGVASVPGSLIGCLAMCRVCCVTARLYTAQNMRGAGAMAVWFQDCSARRIPVQAASGRCRGRASGDRNQGELRALNSVSGNNMVSRRDPLGRRAAALHGTPPNCSRCLAPRIWCSLAGHLRSPKPELRLEDESAGKTRANSRKSACGAAEIRKFDF